MYVLKKSLKYIPKTVKTSCMQLFARPKILKDEFNTIPFHELQQTAAMSQLAYIDPQYDDNKRIYLPQKSIKSKTANDLISKTNPVSFYTATNQGTQGYLWLFPEQRKAYVCFRGTQDFQDAAKDIDIRDRRLYLPRSGYHVSPILVHRGFLDQYAAVKRMIFDDLNTYDKAYDNIIFTGHSLGAALATIGAAYTKAMLPKKQVYCYTYGCPRVGNDAFADWFDDNIDGGYRVFNEQDPVSMIPISHRFCHVTNGLCITDNLDVLKTSEDHNWCIRPFVSALALDLSNLVQDHNIDLYIDRLEKLDKTT